MKNRSRFIFGNLFVLGVALLGLLLSGCTKKSAPAGQGGSEKAMTADSQGAEPSHIRVQHILIGFQGSLPGKPVTRSQEEARQLAKTLFERAKKDANFDVLVKENTDDSAPGIYGMSNRGVSPEGDEFPREQMVPAFGDVGFKLKPGEIGLAEFDRASSPFGFHIIKRLD